MTDWWGRAVRRENEIGLQPNALWFWEDSTYEYWKRAKLAEAFARRPSLIRPYMGKPARD